MALGLFLYENSFLPKKIQGTFSVLSLELQGSDRSKPILDNFSVCVFPDWMVVQIWLHTWKRLPMVLVFCVRRTFLPLRAQAKMDKFPCTVTSKIFFSCLHFLWVLILPSILASACMWMLTTKQNLLMLYMSICIPAVYTNTTDGSIITSRFSNSYVQFHFFLNSGIFFLCFLQPHIFINLF